MFSAEPMEAMFHEHLTYPPAISSSFPPYKNKSEVLHENLDFLRGFPAEQEGFVAGRVEVFYNDHWGTDAGLCAGVVEFTLGFYEENLGTSSRFLAVFDVDHGDILGIMAKKGRF